MRYVIKRQKSFRIQFNVKKKKQGVFPVLKSHTSRSKISSSAFQSGHISGKDRLSCTEKKIM